MSNERESKSQWVIGTLLMVIGLLVGFGSSQVFVASAVTEKLSHVQEGWSGQFTALANTVSQHTVEISSLRNDDMKQVNAINGLHPIIESCIQQNTLLWTWLQNNPHIDADGIDRLRKP